MVTTPFFACSTISKDSIQSAPFLLDPPKYEPTNLPSRVSPALTVQSRTSEVTQSESVILTMLPLYVPFKPFESITVVPLS